MSPTYRLVQRFQSSSSSRVYEVKADEAGNLSCNCPAWTFKRRGQPRTCPHVQHVEREQTHTGPGGRRALFSELTDIPTFQEAQRMDFGRDTEEARKWNERHVKVLREPRP